MNQIKIEYRKTESLVPYVNNARTHSPYQITQLCRSIQEFGFVNPVLVDANNMIVAGHGRVLAAMELKLTKVPVVVLEGLSERQIKSLIIADNKIASNAGWDLQKLADEISALTEMEMDTSILGFNEQELDALLRDDMSILPTNFGSADYGLVAPPPPPAPEPAQRDTSAITETIYTKKIIAPTYTPANEKPGLAEMIQSDKVDALIAEINAADISADDRELLLRAAERHRVFDFEKIADYYAHSEPAVQRLMENSALVIIDFKKAIENGFVQLTKDIQDIYIKEHGDEG